MTRITLFERLRCRPGDTEAWQEFERYYGPMILNWCRRWGVQQADAEDITQLVLLKLSQKMADFKYDPKRSFRAWLKTITHHAWYDFKKTHRNAELGCGGSVFRQLLESVEAENDLLKEIDQEYTRQLLDEAMARVQMRVAPSTWEAFRLTALDGLSGAAAGQRLGISASRVFMSRHHVQKHLKQEMERLDRDSGIFA
jgi:RNA polymerase sigma-70 factor (ECF subfamily)